MQIDDVAVADLATKVHDWEYRHGRTNAAARKDLALLRRVVTGGAKLRSGNDYAYDGPAYEKRKRRNKPWPKQPGQAGFNALAAEKMRAHFEPGDLFVRCPETGTPMQAMAYQKTMAFMTRPLAMKGANDSPRILAVHRTGSGKTFSMIRCAENFFNDARPTILVFPTIATVRNFYEEVKRVPGRFSDWLKSILQTDDLSGVSWQRIQNLLAKKRGVQYPGTKKDFDAMAAPMRAFRYTQAGGTSLKKDPLYRLPNGPDLLNDKVIICDEFHNLVRAAPEVQRYKKQLTNLRRMIYAAKNSVVLGFTATPVVDDEKNITSLDRSQSKITEWQALLELIKGAGGATHNSEGYVSYFNSMPTTTYAKTDPLEPEVALPQPTLVEMQEPNAIRYVKEMKKLKKEDSCTGAANTIYKLQNYANAGIFYSQHSSAKTKALLEGDIDEIAAQATKLTRIAQDIASFARDGKVLVLMHRANGMKLFARLLESVLNKMDADDSLRTSVELYDKGKAADAALQRFNAPSNVDGSEVRVAVADTKEFSEGVSFFGVRHIVIASPPLSWAAYKQQLGRALRSCGHAALPPDQRTVRVHLYVATRPSVTEKPLAAFRSIDECCLKRLNDESRRLENTLREKFGRVAFDADILAPIVGGVPYIIAPAAPKKKKKKQGGRIIPVKNTKSLRARLQEGLEKVVTKVRDTVGAPVGM